MSHIRFNSRVLSTMPEKLGDRIWKWNVRALEGVNVDSVFTETEEVYDAVVVANGHYSSPRSPSLKGRETYKVSWSLSLLCE